VQHLWQHVRLFLISALVSRNHPQTIKGTAMTIIEATVTAETIAAWTVHAGHLHEQFYILKSPAELRLGRPRYRKTVEQCLDEAAVPTPLQPVVWFAVVAGPGDLCDWAFRLGATPAPSAHA
jgi:hypothetical protein